MAISPEAEYVLQLVFNGAGKGTGSMLGAINVVAQQLADKWAAGAASTAPFWRVIMVDVVGQTGISMGGSGAASAAGLGALGIAGISIAVAAGVYISLGAGYYEGRKRAQRRGNLSGFSRGFVAGVLNWSWEIAWSRFMARHAYMNAFDPKAGALEATANNDGLFHGFALGSKVPEAKKKDYRIALRRLAGRADDSAWSKNADRARNEQIDYVIALAGAGVRQGLIVAD